MTRSAVLLLVFNRPDFAAETARVIARQKPPKIYVAADGPRNDAEAALVEATRQAVLNAVQGEVELVTLFRDRNLGCKRAVEEGISWFLSEAGEGTIIEDDCVPSTSFFDFCDEMLERYRDEPRVMHVSGYCHASEDVNEYRFSKYASVWGWATWQRAWQHYPIELPVMTPQHRRSLRSAFASSEEHEYFAHQWDLVSTGRLDTWDFSWNYALLSRQGLAVQPRRNLIRNTGVGDPRAAHTTRARASVSNNFEREMNVPGLAEPDLLLPDYDWDRWFFRTMIAGRLRTVRRLIRSFWLPCRRSADEPIAGGRAPASTALEN